MTYIVGVRNQGVGVLISDTRISFGHQGRNAFDRSLKSGQLFRGCMYAGSGFVAPMRRFIIRFKARCGSRAAWDDFGSFATSYTEHAPGQAFQLLLMSRHSGQSQFYLYESETNTITERQDYITLGSGSAVLDEYLGQFRNERNNMIVKYLQDHDAPLWFFGYYYCLALLEFVQGDAYDAANKHGVGGVFHFSYQDNKLEHRQHPAVYVIVRVMPENRTLIQTLYRVTFEEMALVVEDGTKRSFTISVDSAASPQVIGLSKAETSALEQRVFQGALQQPFYNFLGAGFADEARRGNWVDHINYGNDPYLLTREAIHSDVLKRFVEGMADGSLPKRFAEELKRLPTSDSSGRASLDSPNG